MVLGLTFTALVGCRSVDREDNTEKDLETIQAEYVNPAMFNSEIVRMGLPEINRVPTPYDAKGMTETSFVGLLYEGLLHITEKGLVETEMAQDYSIDELNQQLRFTLKKDLAFHDGTVVKAEHVYNVYQFFREIYAQEDVFKRLKAIEVVDDKTLIFTFTQFKYEDFMMFTLPIYYFSSVSQKEKLKDDVKIVSPIMPLGTGPFKLTSHEENVWTFEYNTLYRKVIQNYDTIKILTLSDQERMEGLKNGTLDIAYLSPNLDNETMIKQSPYLRELEVTSDFLMTLGMNLNHPLFKEKKFRQALQYGIQREKLKNDVWPIGGEVAYAPVPSQDPNYPKEQVLNDYKYDPAKAEALLDELGIVYDEAAKKRLYNNEPIVLNLVAFSEVTWAHKLALRVKEDLAVLGIDVIVSKKDFEEMNRAIFEEDSIDFYTMGWSLPLLGDPAEIYGVNGKLNAGHYSNDSAQAMFVALSREKNLAERQKIMTEWLHLANEEVPQIYMAYRGELWGINERIEGFRCATHLLWTDSIFEWKLIRS